MNAIITQLHAHYRADHLRHVATQMRTLGPPRIRAHRDTQTGAWFALEGTHRLLAAMQLGLAPVLVPVSWPRSARAKERARFAAVLRGLPFPRVEVAT